MTLPVPRAVVAVTGGKGGTGKSFVATNIAVALARRGLAVALADLDVEAPNDHILLGVEKLENREPIEVFFPFIDYGRCTACGACAKACDTGAIVMARGRPPMVMPRLCSGCKACLMVCPYKAIAEDGARVMGYTYTTTLAKWGIKLISGAIREGEEHTPPAVVATKRRALREARDADILVIDTGAGTGNGISIALQDAGLVIAVTEPTPAGVHDLAAILEIVRGMGKPAWIVVNRSGIGDEEPVKKLAAESGAERLFRIPYSRTAALDYAHGRPVVEAHPDDPAAAALLELAASIAERVAAKRA